MVKRGVQQDEARLRIQMVDDLLVEQGRLPMIEISERCAIPVSWLQDAANEGHWLLDQNGTSTTLETRKALSSPTD